MKFLNIAVFVGLVGFSAGAASAATVTFEREEVNGFTLTGSFEYDDALAGSVIEEDDLGAFTMEGFLNGTSLGSWSLADGVGATSTPFNFNYDSLTSEFLGGGIYPNDPLAISWGDTTSGFAFIGGSGASLFLVDGQAQSGSTLPVSGLGLQFSISTSPGGGAVVPLPPAMLMLLAGLAALGAAGFRRREPDTAAPA